MRKLYRTAAVAGAAALTALAAAGCSAAEAAGGPSLAATAAYVQQPTATGKTTVGYLDIRNNGTADKLVSVTTSVGGTVTLRAPVRADATPVVMHTVTDIPLPAHAMTQLVPNSYHLLITGAGPMHDGKDITLKLTFASGGTTTILALVTDPANGGSSYFLN